MVKLKLHLDADTSQKSLHKALLDRRHDVTRTPNNWMLLDASDEVQLLESTFRDRAIFTFNIKDFLVLDRKEPQHSGIILAAQNSWTLSELIAALDALLSSEESGNWIGQVRWLNQWRV